MIQKSNWGSWLLLITAFAGGSAAAQPAEVDDVGTPSMRLYDGLWTTQLSEIDFATDVVIARKTQDVGSEVRPFLESGQLTERPWEVVVYKEEYEVVKSLRGAAAGTIVSTVFAPVGPSGPTPPLRHRPAGSLVVMALAAQLDGHHDSLWDDRARLIETGLVPARAGEWATMLSLPVAATDFASGTSRPSEAFCCTAIEALGEVTRTDAQRTLAMLMNLRADVNRAYAPDRVSRCLIGAIDVVDPRDTWMAYAALRAWGHPYLRPTLARLVVAAASDPENWASTPSWARVGVLSKLDRDPGPESIGGYTGLLQDPVEAMSALESVVDDPLRCELARQMYFYEFNRWRETRLPEVWRARSEAMEIVLLNRLPSWTRQPDKKLRYAETGGREPLNRQELVDFWTAWLGS